jgi:long-chain acyl-CoA synthetase
MSTLFRRLLLADGLYAAAARDPSAVAIRCEDRQITYGELVERVARISNAAIVDLKIVPGDVVAVLAPNCFEYPEIVCGLSDAGAIVATLNPRANAAEVASALLDGQAKAVFTHSSLRIVAREALKLLASSITCRQIVIGDEYETWVRTAKPLARDRLPSIAETDPFSLVYSSGTTGEPKGVLLSHRSRVLTFHAMALEYGCFGRGDRFLALAPMAHGAGFAFAMAGLYFGADVHIVTRFDAESVLAQLASGRFTGVFMVPTHFRAILALPAETLARHRVGLQAVRTIISNAAALPQLLKEQIVDYFGPGRLHESYGSTEAGIVTNIRPEDQLRTAQSVGRPFGMNEVRLLDEQGRDVAEGEIGELFSRSPYLFNGYRNRPDATAEAIREGGWVTAGDLAKRDSAGFLYIVDRKKDMVISGGMNIYPREIEIVLERHPAVREASVVGVRDLHWGERLHAFVVPRNAADEVLADELVAHCRAELSSYKVPRGITFIEAIPRNIGGKVLKRELRSLAEKGSQV